MHTGSAADGPVPAAIRKYARQFRATMLMEVTSYLGDNRLLAVHYLLRLLRVVLFLSVWRLIYAGSGASSPLPLEAVLTYTLVAEAFRQQLECRDSALLAALWEGSVANHLLRPMGIFSQFTAGIFGHWLPGFSGLSIPLLLLAPLLGVNPLPADTVAAMLFLPSLALGIAVGLALEFIFDTLAVFLQNIHTAVMIRNAAVAILSGSLLPLAVLPWGLGRLLAWLPYAAMASIPLRIYTGDGSPGLLLAVQAFWSVLLWMAARRLWLAGQERMVCYGG